MSNTNEPESEQPASGPRRSLADYTWTPYDTGKTHFVRVNFTIQVWKGDRLNDYYEIDLEDCNHPGRLLDMVLQMNKKTWENHLAVREFLLCLENACREVFNTNAQGVYCPGGCDHVVDWPSGTHKEMVKRKKKRVWFTNTSGERVPGWI